METQKISIGGKDYEVLVAKTEEEREQGLMNVIELEPHEGCLFVYEEVQEVAFWMKDTFVALDIVFIGPDMEVISVKQGEPESEEFIEESGVQYVLEVNQNSGIEIGDVLELESDLEANKMYIIGSDGKPQAELLGNERIFSRKSTRVIMRKAEKAYNSKNDADYRSLGRYVFNELSAQDKREPQFVESKEKEA